MFRARQAELDKLYLFAYILSYLHFFFLPR